MESAAGVLENTYNQLFKSGLYHALYRMSEYVGGETWGDNENAYAELIKQIPVDQRRSELFQMLLLGSATSTSIQQATAALDTWKKEGIIKNGKLTVVDISKRGFNGLPKETKDAISFVQADIQQAPFRAGSFDLITSDYVFNFIPRKDIPSTVQSLAELLKPNGIISTSVDTRKNALSAVLVRNGLTKEDLNQSVPKELTVLEPIPAHSRGLAKLSEIGADRIVWSAQKTITETP